MKKSTNCVLNLVINGIPSIRQISKKLMNVVNGVLNLVINGIPSILKGLIRSEMLKVKF